MSTTAKITWTSRDEQALKENHHPTMAHPFTTLDIFREAFPEPRPNGAHAVAFRSGTMMCLERLALYENTGVWQVPLSTYEANSLLSDAFDAGVTYGHQLYERATHQP